MVNFENPSYFGFSFFFVFKFFSFIILFLQHGNAQPGLGLVDDQFDVHASINDNGACCTTAAQQASHWLPSLLLLVTVLAETLLLLVHGHLMALALLSTGHGQMIL
jgi:hypothetical protein